MKHFLLKRLPLLCVAALTCGALTSLAQSLPGLLIEHRTGSQVHLSWTNTSLNIVLAAADSLSPTNLWRPVARAQSNGQFSVTIVMTGNNRFFRLHNLQPDGLPPDPASVAPQVPQGAVTPLAGATEFLYTGPNPIQTGVTNGTIELKRAAIVRGKVKKRDDTPLSGVAISILNHPEFGQTLSRADGMFDLAVNGGGLLTLKYGKTDFCPVQRQVHVPWQDYAWVDDVVMIQMDPIVTSIALGTNLPMQVHQGSMQTDEDGVRRATLLIPPATTAELVMPDGSTHPMTSLNLRATEFTVGPNGPEAMPANLPPTSAYTYCVELTADEAIAAGATDVRFNVPLPFYVENFLGFPVGTSVPLGSYDRVRGVWIPADSGKVIKILGVNVGLADLDTDGDDVADSGTALAELSITEAERQRLAALYQPGQTLWRTLIPHFTPWDANWGFGPEDSQTAEEDPNFWGPLDQCCQGKGSIIEIQNQILGETVAVAGTPFSLNYQSERVPGRKQAYSVEIPLSGAVVSEFLRGIVLEISVAGQFSRKNFGNSTSQSTRFTWDGKTAYGQALQGKQPINIRIGYTYRLVYGSTSRFGDFGGDALTADLAREEITLWRTFQGKIGSWDARGIGLGGWSLSAQHTYDPAEQILNRGDGGRQSLRTSGSRASGSTISTYAGTGQLVGGPPGDGGLATETPVAPEGLAVGPDGSLYIATPAHLLVRRVTPDGIIRTVAGNNSACPGGAICGDGGYATNAPLGSPHSVAVGPDGSLYIGEARAGSQRVRKVAPNGIISTFAGTGTNGYSGDGGPARLAQIGTAFSLAVGPDGSVYMADAVNRRVRRVTPDGIINTVAGTGVAGFSGDGGPATRAMLADPRGVAVGRDGTLYIADASAHRVRMVTPDGIIRTIAGTGVIGFDGEGVPATAASFKFPTAVAIGPDDTIYIVDQANNRVRWMRPGGTINTLAGNGFPGSTGDSGPARRATLQDLNTGLAVGPDGSVYVSQTSLNLRVRRISPPTESFLAGASNEIIVPSEDGSEIYVFALNGQHLRTLEPLTGTLIHRFSYDGAARLTAVTDGDGNETRIERDSDGTPTAIVGPYGHRTTLALNADGFLEQITNPAGETVRLTSTPDGLLTSMTNPRGHSSRYAYDPFGRLAAAIDPSGATNTYTHFGSETHYTVTASSAMGKTTAYRVETSENGDRRLIITDCDGSTSQSMIRTDGHLSAIYADGSRADLVLGPDPRWGMRAPIIAGLTNTAPGGLTATLTSQSAVTLAGPGQFLNVRSRVESSTSNGRTWTNTYHGTNRTIVSTSPAGRQGRFTLDDKGRLAQAQFGTLDPLAFAYDTRGRLTNATLGLGATARIATLHYGPDGFLAGLTDPFGYATSLTNDLTGRVTTRTLPGGRVVGFGYDANGNLRTLTPPGRTEHSFTYNQRDEPTAYTPPPVGGEPAESRFAYNADRNPTRIEEPDGTAIQFTYDGGNCYLSLVDRGGRQRTYAYNAAGQVISVESSEGVSLAYAYDRGILTNVAWSGSVTGSVTRIFDRDFRTTSLRVNGTDPVTLQYDSDGLPTQVGGLTLARSLTNGFITSTTLGTVSNSVTYDGFGAAVSFTASHNGNAVYEIQFNRDALGRLSQRTETVGGTMRIDDYQYDAAGRLAEVQQDGAVVATYDYDANGNRLSRTDSTETLNATYDAQDRLLQYGSTTYAHNPKGERASKTTGGQTTTYRYEGLGNLVGVALPDGTQIDYLLDALDRRVSRKVNGTLVQAFLYQDALRPIAELDGTGAVVSRFVYATRGNVPDYMIKGGVTYAIITDHLGSPRVVLDVATGEIAQRMEHDEFGRVTLDTNPGFQPFGFAGGLYDHQTGLVHFGAREYDPAIGRWTTKDPIGFLGGDANLYAYVLNDPINNVDPFGLIAPPSYLTAAAISAEFAAAVGIIAHYGRNTAPLIVPILTRAGQGLANAGQSMRNFFCSQIPQNLAGRIQAVRERTPEALRQFNDFLRTRTADLPNTDRLAQVGELKFLHPLAPKFFVEVEGAFLNARQDLARALGISLAEAEALLARFTGFIP